MAQRKTKKQAEVLEALRADRRAYNFDTLSERFTDRMDRATVFRILNRFVDQGLAHRIVADDGRQYYAACEDECSHDRRDHGHLHFRCVRCERVECLPEPVTYSLPAGYEVDNFNITLSGTCDSCNQSG